MEKKTYRYTVQKVWRTTPNIVAMNVVPESGQVFDFKAGQFVMLRLLNPDGSFWRQLPFSICTPPGEKTYLQLAWKIFGQFTQRAAALKEGDRVEIAGPFGVFTIDETTMTNIAFLSGGIGITPFLSMMRDATERKLPIKMMLLDANHTKVDIAFFQEIQELASKNPNVSVLFIIGSGELPERVQCAEGRINMAMLEKYCGNFSATWYFLCGPPAFMDAMMECLLSKGVPKERIRKEIF